MLTSTISEFFMTMLYVFNLAVMYVMMCNSSMLDYSFDNEALLARVKTTVPLYHVGTAIYDMLAF